MQIQRIQTLLLFLAAVLMIVLCCCVPVASVSAIGVMLNRVYVYEIMPLLIPALVVAALLVIDVFMYGNLKLQMRIAQLCFWLTIAEAILFTYVLGWKVPGIAHANWVWPMIMLFATAVLTIWARARMNHDYNLIRSSDRIR